MNLFEIKKGIAATNAILKPTISSDVFKSQAETDYEKKKAAEKKRIHDEISRVNMNNINI